MGGSAADVLLSRSGTRCGGQGEDEHRRREGRTGGLRAHCSDRMSSEVSLRPAVGEDREFLFELHKASMGPYVEELFGPWDDAVQWEFFDRWLHPTDTLVIKFGEHDVGVTRIEVHPDHQNRGIGTAVLRRVLADAATTGRTGAYWDGWRLFLLVSNQLFGPLLGIVGVLVFRWWDVVEIPVDPLSVVPVDPT